MTYEYQTQGTCSKIIRITVDEGKVENVEFLGGCNGNLQGIASLTRGMEIEEIIRRLGGIKCGAKNTSCPDQLATALRAILDKENNISK